MKTVLDTLRAHPVITGVIVVCVVGGAIAGEMYLPMEWHAARRIAAGVVSGAGCGLMIVATRVVGP